MKKEEQLKQECEKFVDATISELEPKFKLLESFEKDIQSLDNLQSIISEKGIKLGNKLNEITKNSENEKELDKITMKLFNESLAKVLNHFFKK
jgi:hypothetical protein